MREQLFSIIRTDVEAVSRLSSNDFVVLISALRKSSLLASTGHLLKAQPELWQQISPGLQRQFQSAMTYAHRQKQQVQHELSLISQLLNYEAYPCFVLKGAGHVSREQDIIPGRIMSDIDVLVYKPQLPQFEALLKQHNWVGKEVDDYDDKYYREWAHEIPPMHNVIRDTTLDLHHNIVPPVSGRMPDITLFTADAEQIKHNVAVLRPAASLLHTIVHLIMNEDFSHALRDVADIHAIVEAYSQEPFWQDFYSLVVETGFEQEAFYALSLMSIIFGEQTEVKKVLNQLNPKPSAAEKLWLNIFLSASMPEVGPFKSFSSSASRLLVYLRGHKQKMPLLKLSKHLGYKTYLFFKQTILGKVEPT